MSTETGKGSSSLKKLASTLNGLTNSECQKCNLHQETDRVCIPVNMPTRSLKKDSLPLRLMLVGEAPGHQEERSGQLFSGPAGQYLNQILEKANLNRKWFFVTNAAKCRPVENETPTKVQIKACVYNYLVPEIEAVKPQFGLLLGNSALYAILGKTGITKYNATSFEKYGVMWTAAFHPAAVLRNPKYASEFSSAVLAFSRLVRGEHGEVVTEAVCVNDRESLQRLRADLEYATIGAIDIEAWSPHPGVGRFKGGGLATWDPGFILTHLNITVRPGVGYVIPLWNKYSKWKDPQKVLDLLKPHLEGIEWTMHNGSYDQRGFKRFNLDLNFAFDTMGAQYAIDENARKDLGFMSQKYLSAPEYKDTVDKSKMNEAPLTEAVEYGAKDSDYTFRLRSVMQRQLTQDPLSKRLFDTLLMPATRVLIDVSRQGLPLHRGKFQRRRIECEAMVEKCLEDLKGVNPRSPKQLSELLYGQLDFPVLKMTPKGAPSTDEETLVRLNDLDESGVIDAILKFRHWDGYRSRYFNNWSGLVDSTGRLHPNFKPFHTVTGRLSAEAPNVQQIPRDVFIRGIVGGRRGWRIVEADYSQIELRIAAHYSQDSTMLRIFNTGRDPHTETALAVTGLSPSEITSEIRKKAKAINFGFLFGMGYNKFIHYAKTSYGLDISPAEARATRTTFFDTFRSLQGWHERQRRAAKRRGWVISAIGRKRHLWDITSTNKEVRAEAERQAINSPVQGLASDMMLMSMIILHEKLDPQVARIVSTVHDSIIFEVREEALDEVIPTITEAMENLPLEEWFESILTVPIQVEVKAGNFWSEDAEVVAN